MLSKKNILTFLIFIFFTTVIYFLIVKQIIYPTILPMVAKNSINLFSDWTVILQANICQEKGFDVFVNNPCDYWGRKHVYGEILLNIPYIKSFPKFYFLILPILLNLFFVFTIVKLLTYKNNIKYFSIFVFILSPPVLLAIERANIDIVMFLITVLIAINKNLFVKHILIIFATICKIYPIFLSIIFFFEKNIKKIMINLVVISLLILLIVFFQWDSYSKLFKLKPNLFADGYGMFNFSFIGALKYINSLSIYIDNKNYYLLKFIYLFLIGFIPVVLVNFYYFKKLYNDSLTNTIFLENNFENKLYILSSTIILLCYFLSSSFIYREIFFLGLIPLILIQKKNFNDNNFFTFYFYLLNFKFLFSSILTYVNQNKFFPNFEPLFIISKYTLDFYIVSIIGLTFLFYTKNLIRNVYQNKL
jgi:hypothetical protein